MATDDDPLSCYSCGRRHRQVSLASGQRASCVRCGATLAKRSWFGRDTTLPFVVTGLILALPAAFAPFVTLGQFGREHVTRVTDVARGFWHHDMRGLAAGAWFCGVLAPFGLLLLLLAMRAGNRRRHDRPGRTWRARAAERIAFWAMPEVQVLAVLVAFFKLGDIVNVSVGPGLWCYAIGTVFVLLAWRQHSLRPVDRIMRPAALPDTAGRP